MSKSGIICIILIALVFIGGCFMAVHEGKTAVAAYNNGICSECGGEYRFAGATHLRNSGDRYYYTCQSCGHTTMTYSLMK